MYYLLTCYSQDCETQNEIVGIYSNLIRMEEAILRQIYLMMEIDKEDIDDEQARYALQEVEKVLNNNSTVFAYHSIEIDKDCNIQE